MVLARGTFVTLGGGGFAMSEDGSSLIDDYTLSLTGKSRPKVCFIGTASGDDLGFGQRFEAAFRDRAETSVLSLFCRDPWGYTDPAMLFDQDVVYIGGGSTANLLAVWRLHGLPEVLAQAAANGTIMTGVSAGMNCWYEGSSTDSFGPLAPLDDGLGFLPGSACPHYFGEADRQRRFQQWVADESLPEGYAADDHTALVWRDGVLVEAIGERPDATAFSVTRDGARAVEEALYVRYLAPGPRLGLVLSRRGAIELERWRRRE
jgi:peptidase E